MRTCILTTCKYTIIALVLNFTFAFLYCVPHLIFCFRSVFDVTLWASDGPDSTTLHHPGGPNQIRKWKDTGILLYPGTLTSYLLTSFFVGAAAVSKKTLKLLHFAIQTGMKCGDGKSIQL